MIENIYPASEVRLIRDWHNNRRSPEARIRLKDRVVASFFGNYIASATTGTLDYELIQNLHNLPSEVAITLGVIAVITGLQTIRRGIQMGVIVLDLLRKK